MISTIKSLASDMRVLYVEDEQALRESVASYLRKLFAHVDAAKDGQDGLKHYQENQYDIVISDIQMPYMNGLEMVSEIKAINGDQEVIIVSAYGDAKYFLDAISLGVNSYIIKPLNYEQMNLVLYKTVSKLSRFRENVMYKNHLEELVEERTHELLELEKEKVENFQNTIKTFIDMIESRDTYTGGHSERVANYSKLIAKQLGRNDTECELIYQAGILHDVGKIATPDSILLKPGKLNQVEYQLIKEHVQVGYDLLSHIPMYSEISEIILCHHERYDGTGYPNGLSGNQIPLLSRIMIVADSFDAMTTNRIYKGRKSVLKTLEELKNLSGIQFHPEIVDAACIALQNVDDLEITSQTPSTEIERERFSYFYKDQLTGLYNTVYLDFILSNQNREKSFNHLNILYMHNFNEYNVRHGWPKGDTLLRDVSQYLIEKYPQAMIFRIHGDDFVLLTNSILDVDVNQFNEMEILQESDITISKRSASVDEAKIEDLNALENWLR